LLERYMTAAREISALAIGASKRSPTAETFQLRSDLSQYDQQDGLPFGTRGGAAVSYNFPQDGEYVIRVELLDLFGGAQVREPHQLEIAVDGERAQILTLAPKGKQINPDDDVYAEKPRTEARVAVKAGPRVVTATFIKKTSALAESI